MAKIFALDQDCVSFQFIFALHYPAPICRVISHDQPLTQVSGPAAIWDQAALKGHWLINAWKWEWACTAAVHFPSTNYVPVARRLRRSLTLTASYLPFPGYDLLFAFQGSVSWTTCEWTCEYSQLIFDLRMVFEFLKQKVANGLVSTRFCKGCGGLRKWLMKG